MRRGIIPVVMGGLGNQMFVVAAGYIIQRHLNCPLYLVKTNYSKHNKLNHDYHLSIFRFFGIHLPYTEDSQEFMNRLGYNVFSSRAHNPYEPWCPSMMTPGTILTNTYFQFYKPIRRYENELRELFLKGLEYYRETLADYSHCAFIHVRRGDYLELTALVPNLGMDYYEPATNILREKGVNEFIVTSDDNAWLKEQPLFCSPGFTIFDSINELETLALMSKCTAGAICANSSFSWWGAFLGAYGARNTVIAPKKWSTHPIFVQRDMVNFFPEEWMAL